MILERASWRGGAEGRERAFAAKHVDLEGVLRGPLGTLTNTDPTKAWHNEGMSDDAIRTFVTKIEQQLKLRNLKVT